MRKSKWAVSAAIVAAGLAFNVATANAAQAADVHDCRDTARQVKTALEGKEQVSGYSDAVKERNNGRDFCNAGMYGVGVSHYKAALKLLGAGS